MDKECFALFQPGLVEHIMPDGKEGFGKGCCFCHGKTGRDRQALRGGDSGILGIAAASDQGTDAITDFPLRDIGGGGDNFARKLQPEDFRRAGGRRIHPGHLHQIGPVDASGMNADQNLALCDFGRRHLASGKIPVVAVDTDFDCLHVFGKVRGKVWQGHDKTPWRMISSVTM